MSAVIAGCEPAPVATAAPATEAASVTPYPARSPGENRLIGRFSYMADAALFEDCRSGKRFPVSMEGAYIEVERAYLSSGIEPGAPVLVEIEGRFLERPSMEGNRNIIKVIIDSFIALSDKESCVSAFNEPLVETYWKLTEVGGKAVSTHEGRREAHMVLSGAENRLRGHGGCNRFSGGFTLDGESISFGAMVMTEMGCSEGNDTELAFMNALSQADRHTIGGQILRLYQGDTLLATFEAVHLP